MKEQINNIVYNKSKLIRILIFTLIFIIGFTGMSVSDVNACTGVDCSSGGVGDDKKPTPPPDSNPGTGTTCCESTCIDGKLVITYDGGCCSSSDSYSSRHESGSFTRSGYRFTVQCKNKNSKVNGRQKTVMNEDFYYNDPYRLASMSWNNIRFYYINDQVVRYLLGVGNDEELNDYIDCAILAEPRFTLKLPYNETTTHKVCGEDDHERTYVDLDGTSTKEPKYDNTKYSIKEFFPYVDAYATLYAKYGYSDDGVVHSSAWNSNIIYSNYLDYGTSPIYDKNSVVNENKMRIYNYLTTTLTYGTSNKECYNLTKEPPKECFDKNYKITNWLSTDYYHGWILLKDIINTERIIIQKESVYPDSLPSTSSGSLPKQSLSGAQFILKKKIKDGVYEEVKVDEDNDWVEKADDGNWYKIGKNKEKANGKVSTYTVTTDGSGLASFIIREIGTYKVEETVPLKDHIITDAEKNKLKNREFIIDKLVITNKHKVTVTNTYGKKTVIEKRDKDTKQLIETGKATFDIYSDSNCSNYMSSVSTNKGKAEIIIPPAGTIYIKERVAPTGYKVNDTCIKANSETTVVYDESDCMQICNSVVNGTMDDRIWAYRFFSNSISTAKNYNKFLDLNNKDCTDICKGPKNCGTSTNNVQTNCLSGTYDYNKVSGFSPTDLSCYNTVYTTSSGATAYCLVAFKLDNNLGASTWNVKSGMMPIQKLNISDAVATTGTLTRMCYKYSTSSNEMSGEKPTYYDSNRGELKDNYSDYIDTIIFDGKQLQLADDVNETMSNTSTWYSYKGIAKYNLNPLYAKIGEGKISYTKQDQYKFIGYGVVSKFGAKTQYTIPFTVNFKGNFPVKVSNEQKTSNKCTVKPTQQVVIDTDKLQMEFRIIDTSNPFPGKTGVGRKIGLNWQSKVNLDLDNDGVQNTNDDINVLKEKIESGGIKSVEDFKYDVYPDGKLDDKDVQYMEWVKNDWKNSEYYKDDSYDKTLMAFVMSTTNNSYNKSKKEPKYTFKLTPDIIEKIRKYNEGKTYDDFNLKCDEDGNCKNSVFFNTVGLKLN